MPHTTTNKQDKIISSKLDLVLNLCIYIRVQYCQISITELFLCIRCDPQFQNPNDTLVEAHHKTKLIKADEKIHMRSLLLSLIILVVPLQVSSQLVQ